MQSTKHANVKWAQRKDKLFLTVDLRDIKNEKVDLKPETLKFQGESDSIKYELEINFLEEIVVEESKWNISGLHMQFILKKKDTTKPYWVRLTKENKKYNNITIDWQKYIDEDDEGEEGHKGLEDMDQNKFQDFQGGDEHDSDDEPQNDGGGK